jgi:hypothetical protein
MVKRKEWFVKRVGHGYLVKTIGAEDGTGIFDVEFVYGGRHICTLHSCYSSKSAERHHNNAVQNLSRLMLLIDGYTKACYNKSCYSRDGLGIESIPMYQDYWDMECDKIKTFVAWIDSQIESCSLEDSIRMKLKTEFNI